MVASRLRIEESNQHMLRYKPGKQVFKSPFENKIIMFLQGYYHAAHDELCSIYDERV